MLFPRYSKTGAIFPYKRFNMHFMNTRLSSTNKEEYKENGFIIIKNLISMASIAEIHNDAIEVFKRQLARLGYHPQNYSEFEKDLYKFFREDQEAFINCGKHIQHLISLHRLSLSKPIIDVAQGLGLTTISICTRPTLFFNNKHLAINDIYHTMPPHQDWKSMQGSLDAIVIWFPLVNVRKKLGALEVVPRSHNLGLMTSRVVEGFGLVDRFEDKDFVSIELDVGDALFFNSFLVHRSGNNTTESIRWSCHLRLNNMDDPDFIMRKFPHPYIYKPLSKID